MKRTNVYLEESMIERLARLADERGLKSAEVLREVLRLGLDLYEEKGVTADIEYVRQKMIEKHGKEVTYDDEFAELAREKAIEYRDMQNSRARIATLVERQDKVEATLARLVAAFERNEGDGR